MEEYSSLDGQPRKLGRRDFLKLAGLGMAALFAPVPVVSKESELPMPIVVHGIEVYDLSLEVEKIDAVLNFFDSEFDKKLGIGQSSLETWQQREKLLPNNKRYLQFVVTESVYSSFLRRQNETGVDLIQWLKLHVDLMNIMSQTSDFPVDLKTEIKRVVVVPDSATSNLIRYTKDVDAMWYLDSDYRVDQSKETGQGYFWSFARDGDMLKFRQPPSGEQVWKKFDLKLDAENTFDEVRDGVWLDLGLIHELIHQTWNLHDEYIFNEENSPFRFKRVELRTGNFTDPYLSPYSAVLLRYVLEKKIRGYYTHPLGIGSAKKMEEKYSYFNELPKKILFSGEDCLGCEVYRTEFKKADYYSPKNYMFSSFCPTHDSLIEFSNDALLPQQATNGLFYPTELYLKFKREGGEDREVFLPLGILNMAKICGSNNVEFKMIFDDSVSTKGMSTQFIELVHESDIDEFLALRDSRKYFPYAKTKIESAGVWVLWYLQK